MSEVPKIIDLDKVISPHLNGAQLVSYTSKFLTKPGDNYGSVMLSINATLKQTNGKIEEQPLIAKLPPLTNDLYWQLFQPERTCISENAVYKYLAPEFEKLQKEAGVQADRIFDGFPRYFGSRISLKDTAPKVDRDAILVQENLQISGYKSGDRLKPYDLEHALLVLKYLAQYHALPIALRTKKPTVFNQFVRPNFRKFNMNRNLDEKAKDEMYEDTLTDLKAISNNSEKEVSRVRELYKLFDAFLAASDVSDEPYNSIVHCDLWINNIMIKYDEDGKPERVKLIDFQIAQYESVVHDVLFFLLSSVDTTVLEQNYENLLMGYYENFIGCLQNVQVATNCYSFKSFLDEIKRVGYLQVPHAIFMTKVIMADNSTLPEDFKDMDFSVMSKNTGMETIKIKLSDILRLAKKFDILY